ncbi:hypothetical protein KO566_03050 [Flavobacteriaceae bacterium XHP0103]|uniref:hypothetical protein n=1 Tax=Marixanthotalea marina TaxID=2844359 RepID=UPI002989F888|nr:hypothetical protein [Marixanthotalea marina]MBU3821026.1 hypothetical protein [Marixanthotalea marina]
MININKSNYEFYKGIFKVIWEIQAKYSNMDSNADFSPLNVLESLEKQSGSLARKGLKEGLRDSLTWIKEFPIDLRTELDKNLISKKIPSINILTSQINNVPNKVLEKGKIKDLNEYYLIKEVLDDVEYEISGSQRAKLNKIFVEFELNYKEKNTS